MLERALCPTLVGREEQLFALEDALLAAHRGESRFVALGGEAGMGKTRLATELARRARRLDWEVLWGACSEAELPLPYLPLVEALGNYLSRQDVARLAGELGAARLELAQLFPQLGGDELPASLGDPAQAKLRLFEAVVALLAVPAHEHGLLLVVEDVHWAESATRELLDHLARRLTNVRSLVLVTYRSDELDRRHPVAPLLQTWRRSALAEHVALAPLDRGEIAEMIAAILDDEEIGPELRDLMHGRTEGNPFVLEEMLKEAIDRGDVVRTGHGWQARSLGELRIPETVRDTILLRFARLDPAEVEILRAAAVLGRTFDYATLVAVAGAREETVHGALDVGVAQQLLEEVGGGHATYRWRHALTQEAVADEIVRPRRQQVHSRAADVLIEAGASSLEVARHLLGAARFDEAVPACVEAAEEAEAAIAYMRIAGLYKFEFDDARSLEMATKAVEVAREAGADFERVWAESWAALALLDTSRADEGTRLLDECFEEARRRGYRFIAHNIAYNDAWSRLHTMTPGVGDRADELAAEPGPAVITDMLTIAASWALRAKGDLLEALDAIEGADRSFASASEKVRWRTKVELAEVLLELGRLEEAAAALPAPSERAELQDLVYDATPQIRLRLADGRLGEAVALPPAIARHADRDGPYRGPPPPPLEAFVAAGPLDDAQAVVDAGRAHPTDVGVAFLDEAQGRILLARGAAAEAQPFLARVARGAGARGFRLVEWRARTLAAEALGRAGPREDVPRELAAVAAEADAASALLIRDRARAVAGELGLAVPELVEAVSGRDGAEPELVRPGERLVTSMFADVRGLSAVTPAPAPADLAERIETLHRWAAAEVGRHHGFVDKFAGDAVMATFNATGTRLDHARQALEAALALSGKAALLDLGVGIGIAVGPAVVGRTVAGGNVSVLGTTTNLAARLQTAAEVGEIVLSEEAHRRVAPWLAERGLEAVEQALELKGFDHPQPAWRLRA